ncbi:ABC-type sugar transport system, periplasmic component [Rubidibacter lacunae KORDI 51-2]|uniref:ABC-type sugar transport system, periplasmic component n=1 Tax=Rubidibacter lacunae KORDI 51-2 TaxID=582515 RepID=U5DE83_9CHRO|nr:ABC transporter substrate-binding protein [Rubidibacter lacunae]ERN39936.1 ABC-type sugar transport system, periplasmic component [Rubidibacter lacunae KORDI 51-2]
MKQRSRRWQTIAQKVAAIFLCALLAGCGLVPRSDVGNGPVRLMLWHGINPPANRDVLADLVAEFNRQHSDVQLEARYIGQPDGQLPKILAAVAGNVLPDLLWFTPQLTGQLVTLGAIHPLDDWLERSRLREAIAPALFESMQLDGHWWSVPFATNNAAIFYRPSLFAEAGIESLPQTWDELEAAARCLTRDLDGDGIADRHGMMLSLGKGEWTVFAWLPFVFSAGGELLADGQPNLPNPGAIAALDFGANLVATEAAILSAPERGYELDAFLSGRVAMQITGPWTLGQLSQLKVDYGVFPFPRKERRAAVVGGENLFVTATVPERERAAHEFLAYVLSEEFQTQWALQTGYLPIAKRARASDAYQQYLAENPVLEVFLQQMEVARSRPIVSGYTQISENFGRAIEATLLGKQSAEEALQKSQRRLELIFADR